MRQFSLLGILFVLSSCKLAPLAPSSASVAPAEEAALAVISSTLEDFEYNSQFRVDAHGYCARTVSCGVSNPHVTHFFSSCGLVPGVSTLTGSTTFTVSASACQSFIAGHASTSSFTTTKNFNSLVRVDSVGQTDISVPSGITGLYSSTNDQWQILIPAMTRLTTVDSTIVENLSLESTSVLTSTGRRSEGARILFSGGLTINDTMNQVAYAVSPQTLKWGSATCCYPSSGKLVATVSGTGVNTTYATHTETLEFNESACGAATFTDANGTSSVTLSRGCE